MYYVHYLKTKFWVMPSNEEFRFSLKHCFVFIKEGDIIMMYSTTTGTHNHEWLGNPPTGNKLSFNVVDIFRIEDGKIAEHWDVADTMRMAMQPGRKMQE